LNIKSLFTIALLLIITSVNAQEKLISPPYLKVGDTIAIVAPAGILQGRQATIQQAQKLAESWGLKVVIGKNIYSQNNHFAGTDDERCQDFQDALDNKKVKAIWAARGGYGSVRILDMLDFTEFNKNPKWVIGYSDITAFHNHIHNLGFETLHAMMPTSLEEKPEEIIETIATFKKALFGENLKYEIPSSPYNRVTSSSSAQASSKEIKGELIGGNLAILTSMLGSKSQLKTENKILFIEEIGEYKYSIDRMLQSLKRAGYFTKVNAVIVGDMSLIKKNTTKWGSSIEQLILDIIPEDIPVLFDFPAGHEAENRAMIFGRVIKLAVGSEQYSVIFED
tara:strand:+ start:7068 stop:8078 length:1011 start_codon:yes stop_codon:yes gene_type:complete